MARKAPPTASSSQFASISLHRNPGAAHGKEFNGAPRLDHFFSAVAARLDLWRDLARTAQAWASSPASRGDAELAGRGNEALTALLPLEDFQAYPGAKVMNAIKQRVAVRRRDGHGAAGAARLVGADVAELSQRCR